MLTLIALMRKRNQMNMILTAHKLRKKGFMFVMLKLGCSVEWQVKTSRQTVCIYRLKSMLNAVNICEHKDFSPERLSRCERREKCYNPNNQKRPEACCIKQV